MNNIGNNENNLDEYYIVITDEKEKIRLLKIAFGDEYINYIWTLLVIITLQGIIKPLADLSFNVLIDIFLHKVFNADVLIK